LEQLALDPIAQAKGKFIRLLFTAKRAYELFRCEHNPSFIYPPSYKQLQAFLLLHTEMDRYTLSLLLFLSFIILCGYSLKHPAPDKVPSENPPPKVGPLFLILFYLIIYVQHLRLQPPPSPAIATNGRPDKEHKVEVIILASEDNVPLNILSPSGLVCYFTLYLCLSLLLVLIFPQGPMQVNDKPAAPLLPKKDPPKQPSGKACKVL